LMQYTRVTDRRTDEQTDRRTELAWHIRTTAYLLHNLSYSRFCVENCEFSLPWQQEFVQAKCDWHSLIGQPPITIQQNQKLRLYLTKTYNTTAVMAV